MNHRRRAFISWAKRGTIAVPGFAEGRVEPEFLSVLDRLLAGKRFAYLGEPDHFNLEKYDFRLTLTRELFRRGWRHIGMETGRSVGRCVDRYLQTGDRKHLEYDRAPSAEDVAAHGKTLDFVKEQGPRFVERLRTISESRPVGTDRLHYFGYDVDLGGPKGAYEDIRLLLAEHSSNATVEQLLRSLERTQGQNAEQQIGQLTSLLRNVICREEELVGCLGDQGFREFRGLLASLRDSVSAAGRQRWAQNRREHLKWGARRECAMFRYMMESLATLPSGEKVILMGHNYHLAKDFTQLRMAPAKSNVWGWRSRMRSVGYSLHAALRRYALDRMWGSSVGTLLSTMFPEEVLSIWMLYGSGQLMGRKGPVRVRIKSDTIESLLAEVGERFLLPLDAIDRDAVGLLENANFRDGGGYYGSGNLTAQTDALFFVRKVSAGTRTESP